MSTARTRTTALLTLLLVTAAGLVSWAQVDAPRTAADMEALRAAVETFLQQLANDEVDEAFAALLEDSNFSPDNEEVQSLIRRSGQLAENYGGFRSIEFVDAQRLGTGIVHLRYLFRCKRFPLIWYFTYYRSSPDDPWTVITVRYDTKLETVLRSQRST